MEDEFWWFKGLTVQCAVQPTQCAAPSQCAAPVQFCEGETALMHSSCPMRNASKFSPIFYFSLSFTQYCSKSRFFDLPFKFLQWNDLPRGFSIIYLFNFNFFIHSKPTFIKFWWPFQMLCFSAWSLTLFPGNLMDWCLDVLLLQWQELARWSGAANEYLLHI